MHYILLHQFGEKIKDEKLGERKKRENCINKWGEGHKISSFWVINSKRFRGRGGGYFARCNLYVEG